jgi:glucosylceramidase
MSTDLSGAALSGLSWHCYFGAPGVMSQFRRADPRLDQIVDECSPGLITPTPTAEIVISSLRDWASTVALWNLALDPDGGPVEAPNHGCPG